MGAKELMLKNKRIVICNYLKVYNSDLNTNGKDKGQNTVGETVGFSLAVTIRQFSVV